MTIELNQPITISKVNIRKKGPADARILMIDIKLAAVTDPGILASFDPSLRHFMFADTGSPRMRQLKPIGWQGELAHMEIDIAGERFIGAILTKFKFEALPSGKLAMSCVASVHPEARQTAILADLAGDEVPISICPEPQLDLQQPDEEPRVATPSAEDWPIPNTFSLPPAKNGTVPNKYGAYICEPDEVIRWQDKRDWLEVGLLEVESGFFLWRIEKQFGDSKIIGPFFRNNLAHDRLHALQDARSELINRYTSRGLDCGLNKAKLAKLEHFTNTLMASNSLTSTLSDGLVREPWPFPTGKQ